MSNIENMEAGNQLITSLPTWNNPVAKSGPKGQSEDQGSDFLKDVLSKVLGLVKPGPADQQGNPGGLNRLGPESLTFGSDESLIPIEALENKDSLDQTLSFHLETTGDQIKESGDEDEENKTVWSTSFPPLESLFIGKKDLLKDIFKKTEDVNPGLSNAILLKPGEGLVSQPDLVPVEGAQAGGKGIGKGSPGSGDPEGESSGSGGPEGESSGSGGPEGESLIERPSATGIFLQGAGSSSSLSKTSLFSEGGDPVIKSDRPPVEGAQAGGKGTGEGSPGSADPEEESSGSGGPKGGSPGSGDPKGESPIERPSATGIFLQGAGSSSSLSRASLFSEGGDPVIISDRSPVEGAQAGGKGSGEGSPGLVNSTEENPVERPERKGSLDPRDGLKPPLEDNLLPDKLKTFFEKISQSLADPQARNRVETEEEKSGFKKSMEQPSGKDNLPKEGLAAEIRVPLAQDRPFSTKIMMKKAEWTPSEKGKEGQPSVSFLTQEGIPDYPQGLFPVKDREGAEIIFDIKGLNNNDLTQSGENPPGNGSRQAPILPTVPNDPVHGESMVSEKSIKNTQDQLHHFPKTFELDFLKDHYFSVKKQTPSSMEISLEPAGLGKLDIELNLNQDRLQGQIMVNDKAGKELIERNLPQLLSDLARGGLQIGGFSVSLRHQGRGQDPVLTRTEFEEPSLGPVSPEKMVPIQGNHLIHIIV